MHKDFSLEELAGQHTAELPVRHLMAALTVLGLPLVGVDGVNLNVDTRGPNWLGSVGSL